MKFQKLVWVVLISAFANPSAQAIECDRSEAVSKKGAPVYRVSVSDTAAKIQQWVSYSSISERDGAWLKCRQLSSVHSCSKIGTETVAIHGIGEHVKEWAKIDIYGHTLQSPVAQFVRWGWSDSNECTRDLVESIVTSLRY